MKWETKGSPQFKTRHFRITCVLFEFGKKAESVMDEGVLKAT